MKTKYTEAELGYIKEIQESWGRSLAAAKKFFERHRSDCNRKNKPEATPAPAKKTPKTPASKLTAEQVSANRKEG